MRKVSNSKHREGRRAWPLALLTIVAICGGCSEPDKSKLRVGINLSRRELPGEVIDVVVFDGEVLRQRGAEVSAFLAAHDRAVAFLQSHREEAWRVMGQREHLSSTAFGHMLTDGIILVGPAEQAAYFGPSGKLQPLVDRIARTLRANHLLSDRADLSDCIAGR